MKEFIITSRTPYLYVAFPTGSRVVSVGRGCYVLSSARRGISQFIPDSWLTPVEEEKKRKGKPKKEWWQRWGLTDAWGGVVH